MYIESIKYNMCFSRRGNMKLFHKNAIPVALLAAKKSG